MCLIILLNQVAEDTPLLVASNRDEYYDRPSEAMTVLRDRAPRIIGGRDVRAGGTWLAANEHGVVACITNRPTSGGRNPTKRSRGELPLVCATQATAADAVATLVKAVRPNTFNPSWLLVGDQTAAFAVGLDGHMKPTVHPLPPGIHVLENRPFAAPSPKVEQVLTLIGDIGGCSTNDIVLKLRAVQANHSVPDGPSAASEIGRTDISPERGAACVHTENFGTRWSAIVRVPPVGLPALTFTDGAPCHHPAISAAQFMNASLGESAVLVKDADHDC